MSKANRTKKRGIPRSTNFRNTQMHPYHLISEFKLIVNCKSCMGYAASQPCLIQMKACNFHTQTDNIFSIINKHTW